MLYGLLQDETVIAAIDTAGGDPDALEDRVLAALAARCATTDDAHDDAAVGHRSRRDDRTPRRPAGELHRPVGGAR